MVKYQVERRPVDDTTGKVYRGLGTGDYVQANGKDQQGEPWIVHSTHYSIDSAKNSAATLASAISSENVRIVKVITGSTVFKLN